MKRKNKYLLGFSILATVTLGIIFGKPLIDSLYPSQSFVDTPHALVMARDIVAYTQNADAIIVGEVKEVSAPYLRKDRGLTSQQDIKIAIKEVLKGENNMDNITILIEGAQTDDEHTENEISFKTNEKVLLFLGTNSSGDYVTFAGPYGKYLINDENNVSSIGEFKMPLEELKAKIRDALKISTKK